MASAQSEGLRVDQELGLTLEGVVIAWPSRDAGVMLILEKVVTSARHSTLSPVLLSVRYFPERSTSEPKEFQK